MSRKKNKKKTNPSSSNHNNNHQQRHHQQQHHNGPAQLFEGKLETTRSGMAFVIVEGVERDIMVRPHDLNTAQNGDEVTVKVVRQGKGRAEGIITKVNTRKKNEFTGTLQVSDNFAFLVSDKNATLPDIYIPLTALKGGVNGDKALVKITNWGGESGKSRKPSGEVVEVLDARNAGDLAMKEILVDNGFTLHFPDEVMAEVAELPLEISAEEIAKRKDFRKILTFTIDPYDAKDFDDAISIRLLKTGNYEVGVHIADVSHYVRPGTALEAEGYKRATSVYLPDRVLPMLPEKISNELCSLRPHEDKLTFSAMFEMTKEGKVKNKWIGRTVIHSDHRFTYEEVQEVIENGDGPHYRDEILLLNTMARALRAERFSNGAINFSSTEVKFQLDEDGKPVGVTLKESKEAHQLIEELMLLANRTVAEYVSGLKVNGNPVPFPYRVHDNPDEEKLKIFAVFALQFGYKFDMHNSETVAASFNKMLQMAHGKPEQHVLETMGIRTMSKASYTTSNIGHYGLGFEHYAHFTSPIRRYPDVTVHRVLQECLSGDIHPDPEMESKCKHSSEMERKAMECERAGNKYKQVEYMQQFIGDTFDGIISGVSNFGFWVETVDTKCEGLVSIHSLTAKDDFRYNENEYALVGANTGIKFSIGDKVKIKVMAANLDKRQLDYDLDEPGYGRVAGDIPQRNVGRGHGQQAPREMGEGRNNRNRDRDRKKKGRGDQQEGEQQQNQNEGQKRPIVEYQHKQPQPESEEALAAQAQGPAQPISGETPAPKLSKNQKRKQRAAAKKQRAIEEALRAKQEEAATGAGTFPVGAPATPVSQPPVPAGKKGKVKEAAPVVETAVPAKKGKKKAEAEVQVKKTAKKAETPKPKKETAVKAKPTAKPKATDKKTSKPPAPEKIAKTDLKKVKSQAKPVPAKKLKEVAKFEKAVAKTAKAATKAVTSQKAKTEKKKVEAIAAAKKLKAKKAEAPAKKATKKAEPAKKAVAKKVKEVPKKKAAATPAKKDKPKKSVTPAKKAVTAAKPKAKAKAKPVAKPKAAAKKAAVKAKPKVAPKAKPVAKPAAKPKAAAKKAAKAAPKAKAKAATKTKAAPAKAKAKAAAKKAVPKKKK